jgi:hypothetical protein
MCVDVFEGGREGERFDGGIRGDGNEVREIEDDDGQCIILPVHTEVDEQSRMVTEVNDQMMYSLIASTLFLSLHVRTLPFSLSRQVTDQIPDSVSLIRARR